MKRILSADNGVINHIEKLHITSVINIKVFISMSLDYIEFSGCPLTKNRCREQDSMSKKRERLSEIREINEIACI